MTLKDLGCSEALEKYKNEEGLDAFEMGRVVTEHKDRYMVQTANNVYESELIGNLRFTAESRYDFPAVGDWVALSEYDQGKALIHAIYPRQSTIERKAVGKSGQVQIIASNIDFGLIVQAVDRDFNINRLERYLTICNASKVNPIVILSKIDLASSAELDELKSQIIQRVHDVQIICVSNQTSGYEVLKSIIEKGKTYCLLGSSGVGKSTIINGLSGDDIMNTGEISNSVNKGKHTTSHRELIVLKDGGILIDNPGMREVGIADTSTGLETTFSNILAYAIDCRYKDCTHTHENGCAVLDAVENGDIDVDSYANFRKMEKEKNHFESDAIERKKKDKSLGKMIKKIIKEKKKHKY